MDFLFMLLKYEPTSAVLDLLRRRSLKNFLIEKPLRNKTLSFKTIGMITTLFVFTAVTGLIVWQGKGFPERYPEIEGLAKSRNTYRPGEEEVKKCSSHFTSAEICTAIDLNKPAEVAIIGDSHSPATYYGVKNYYKSKNLNLVLVANYATSPLKGLSVKRSQGEQNSDSIINYVTKNKNIHTVILSAFWASYFENAEMRALQSDHKYKLIDPRDHAATDQNMLFEKGLRDTFEALVASGKKIIFVYNVPLINFSVTRCFARPLINHPLPCSISEQQASVTYTGYKKTVEKLLREPKFNNIKTFDPVANFCKSGSCAVVRDDQLLYHDTNHLTLHGSVVLYEGFGD